MPRSTKRGAVSLGLQCAVRPPNLCGMDIYRTLYTTRGAGKAVAEALGISDAAVSQWKRRGIPSDRQAEVERVLADYVARLSTAPEPVS